jgi:hypothetical protein
MPIAISPAQFFIFVIVFIVIWGIYQIYTLKDKIHCTFIRKDRTSITKLAKVKADRIDFDNKWYNLDIKRTTLKMVWVGFIFPTWVRCLIFRFDSNMPLDPADWSNDYDKPEDRKALNRSENIQSLMVNNKNSFIRGGSGKKSMLEQWIPLLTIVGFIALGYMLYQSQQKTDMLGQAINTVQSQLLEVMKNLPQ